PDMTPIDIMAAANQTRARADMVAERAAALVDVTKDDIAIEVSVNSLESAPVIVGELENPSSAPIEISLLSGEGSPVVEKLENLPPDMPADDDMLAALAGFDQQQQPPPVPDEPEYAVEDSPQIVT